MQHFITEHSAIPWGVPHPTPCRATDSFSMRFSAGSFLILKKVSKWFPMICSTVSLPESVFEGVSGWGVAGWSRQCEPSPSSQRADGNFHMPSTVRSILIS